MQLDRMENLCQGFILTVLGLLLLTGCRGPQKVSPPRPTAPVSTFGQEVVPSDTQHLTPDTQSPLPLQMSREELAERLQESLRKRVMGRLEALRDVERVVHQVGPIVREAVRQPQVQEVLGRMAAENGVTVEAMKARWVALQEADLLLEAGGSAEAVSPSQAVGVAQWLAGTAQGVGLKVNRKESRRLTEKIAQKHLRFAWLEYLVRPDVKPNLPGAPSVTREQATEELPALRGELERLREKRRNQDARYDPRQAIFAQTRYLLRLYDRFPGLDWLFQAYHGGEGGVTKTLRLYLQSAWPGSAEAAIRFGNQGRSLGFEEVYFTATPRSHSAAFSYLYGRSDDHRHYWWKIKTAQEAIALYRHDPNAFRKQWEALLPGKSKAVLWYPNAVSDSLPDLAALQNALTTHRLVPINPRPEYLLRLPMLDTPNAKFYTTLKQACRRLRPLTKPALELASWRRLLAEIK